MAYQRRECASDAPATDWVSLNRGLPLSRCGCAIPFVPGRAGGRAAKFAVLFLLADLSVQRGGSRCGLYASSVYEHFRLRGLMKNKKGILVLCRLRLS